MTQLATEFQSNPYVAGQELYINGLNLGWGSNTTLTVAVGSCRDSTNVFDMAVTSVLTINGAVNGINGLDTGTLAASTVYYVYLVGDLQGFNATGAVISTSATQPVMPAGYGLLRKLGRVRTDGSVHFLKFYSTGLGRDKLIQLDALLALLNNGTATSFTAVNCLIGIGGSTDTAMSTPVYLSLSYTPTAAASVMSIRPTGSAVATGSTPIVLKSSTAAVEIIQSGIRVTPGTSSSVSQIDYVVASGDSVNIFLSAFEENL